MMVQFTQPKGDPVWINLEHIEKFQESHNKDGSAICLISGHIQIVLELPKTVFDVCRPYFATKQRRQQLNKENHNGMD